MACFGFFVTVSVWNRGFFCLLVEKTGAKRYFVMWAVLQWARAHYVIESKVQWKPFWLATQQYPQIDWLGGKFPYTMTYAHCPHKVICLFLLAVQVRLVGQALHLHMIRNPVDTRSYKPLQLVEAPRKTLKPVATRGATRPRRKAGTADDKIAVPRRLLRQTLTRIVSATAKRVPARDCSPVWRWEGVTRPSHQRWQSPNRLETWKWAGRAMPPVTGVRSRHPHSRQHLHARETQLCPLLGRKEVSGTVAGLFQTFLSR